MNGSHVSCVDFGLAIHDPLFRQGLSKRHSLNRFRCENTFDHTLVVGWQELGSGGPVGLDGVITRRVMARRNHDAARGFLVANREGQFRRTANAVEKIYLETRGCHHFRAQLGKVARLVARIIGDGAGEICRSVRALYIIREPLGALPNRAIVDGVGANGIHPAAAPARAKGNRRPEGIIQLLPFSSRHALGDLGYIFRVSGFGEPIPNIRDCSRR